MRTVRRTYHISYDNINLFHKILSPLLILSCSLKKRRIQKELDWR